MKNLFIILSITLIMFSACATNKQLMPTSMEIISPRLPIQQELISNAARQAISETCKKIEFRNYAGKKARIEINGVFPHSNKDLLDYIAGAVEAKAAEEGVLVEMSPVSRELILDEQFPRSENLHNNNATISPDLRLLVSVDWGGIDYSKEKYWQNSKLTTQLIFAAVTICSGGVIDAMSMDVPVFSILGAVIPSIWFAISPPIGHKFVLKSRVHMTISVIPLKKEIRAGTFSGNGQDSIVVDDKSSTGYLIVK